MYKQLLHPTIRVLLLLFLSVILFLLIKYTIGYIYPFLIAFLLAALLNPAVTYVVEKWKVPRTFATFMVIIAIFLVFFGILFILISEIIRGTGILMDKLPHYYYSFIRLMEGIFNEHILPFYQSITSYFQSLDPSHQETIQENVKNFLENLANSGTSFIQSTIIQLPEVVGMFPGSITIVIFIVLATFMMVNDWPNLTDKFKAILPENVQRFIHEIQKGIKKAFSGYIKAQFILIFISAGIIFIGLLILGIEHALTISALVALVDFLPVFGTGLIFFPWILYTFITGNYSLTIGLSILYMSVVIVRQLIEPKILSASIGINPLISLIILLLPFRFGGIAGVLFAPGILILVYVLFQSEIIKKLYHFIKG
ncbi:sporulation integral membrane protein YtvI [Ornithinibacillus scapharcae]|uniref:sporulation integral membrane protein YtvI n=1 Tax=Ornithinibacillus scapharcae TaxID=1147159 RepID=UPI000225C10A|nr:sporulation integral membrane protein YtvI [Ornithinibacillus scapharcae]